MDGYGIFVESLKGNFIAMCWYADGAEARRDAAKMNIALEGEDTCGYQAFIVRPLNLDDYNNDTETY